MPRIDKMSDNTQYFRGIYPVDNYMNDWKINETISILVRSEIAAIDVSGSVLVVNTPSGTVIVSPTVITGSSIPSIGYYSYTPTTTGNYTLSIVDSPTNTYLYESKIRVRENDQDLIEIEYVDSDNRYGGYWWQSASSQVWQPKAYFQGQYVPGAPKNDYSTYTDDPGEPKKLQASPQNTFDIIISDISNLQLKQINAIFSCSDIKINGQPIENEDIPEFEQFEKSNIGNVTINVTEVDNDYYVKNY
jgi:hypothetical protein